MARSLVFLIVLLGLVFPATAQSLNIDVGDPGSEPPSSYAAAGLPGVWNSVTGAHITPFTPGPTPQDDILVDLDGNLTNVGFHQFGGMDMVTANDPSVTGADAELLNDYLATHSGSLENCMYLNGLQNGMYEVITYAWMPNFPLVTQKVRFDFVGGCVLVGGSFNGHAEGITYSVHLIQVTSGRIGLHSGIPAGGDLGIGAAFNGMQVRLLGEDPIQDCGVGAVNAGCGAIEDVLLVNGENGGGDRTLTITPTTPLSISVQEPTNRIGDLAPSRACIYAWGGEPGSGDIVTVPLGLGNMCFGPFIIATKNAVRTWNALGSPNKLGVHNGPGSMPVIADGAVRQLLNLPFGAQQTATITFQGIIEDDCSQGSVSLSVTNGFVVRIQ